MRFERGERIVGDLRLRRAHDRDERRLARVREPDERGVGHQLQLELQPTLLAVLTLLGEARRAARVRQEARVAAPALSTARREPRVAVVDQVGEQLTVHRAHDGALGHVDDEIGAALAVQLLPLAVCARAGLAVRMITEREQRRDVAVRAEPHVATAPTVAAVGSALRARATPGGIRRSPRRHRHPSRCSARYRRTQTSLTRIRRQVAVSSVCATTRPGPHPRARPSGAPRPRRLQQRQEGDRPPGHDHHVDQHRRRRAPRRRPRLRRRRPQPSAAARPPRSQASAVFTTFTITPASPVACNAPTMIELKWTAKGASSVVLSIDGVQGRHVRRRCAGSPAVLRVRRQEAHVHTDGKGRARRRRPPAAT